MDIKQLIKLISEGKSTREIGKILGKSQGSIKYWLGKYDLKTTPKRNEKGDGITEDGRKRCSKCGEWKFLDDYYLKNKDGDIYGGYCKSCSNKRCCDRVIEVKLKMITYKGSACSDCTLHIDNTHYSVFEFHHINPTTKDPNFAKIKYQCWEKIEKEIDKCILLCANCHRIRHHSKIVW